MGKGGDKMGKKKSKTKDKTGESKTDENSIDLRVSPEDRLTPKFDEVSIAKFHVSQPGRVGMRVLDNCAEEHIM